MLLKVMKHELIANGKILWIVYAGSFVLCALTGLLGYAIPNNSNPYAVSFITSLYSLSVMGIAAMVGCTIAVPCARFGKNMVGKEAYFTFSLPVKNYIHLLSRLLVTFIAVFASGIVLLLDIIFLTGVTNFAAFLGIIGAPLQTFSIIMLIFCFYIVAVFSMAFLFCAAMSFGTILSKNKNMGTFLALVIFYGANQIIMSFLAVPFLMFIVDFLNLITRGSGSFDAALWGLFGVYFAIQAIYCAIYYLVSWLIYCRKLRIGGQ